MDELRELAKYLWGKYLRNWFRCLRKWLAPIIIFCLPTLLSFPYAIFALIIMARGLVYLPLLLIVIFGFSCAVYMSLKNKPRKLWIMTFGFLLAWIPYFIYDHNNPGFLQYLLTVTVALYYASPLFIIFLILTIRHSRKKKRLAEAEKDVE